MTTPAMGLALPTPSVTQGIGIAPPGQSWGEQQNSNWSIVDTHTHAPGSGSPVPTSGIAINADLPFGGFNAIGLRTTRFAGLVLGSLGPNDKSCLLASSGDLYFVDGAGNQVRITASGGVAGTPGAISGLVSPAAVTYTPASKLFTFTSSTPRVAGISAGPLTIGDASVDNGFGVTISAPAGLAANYSLTLPLALPGANALLSLSTTGALSAFGTVAGSDLSLAGNLNMVGVLTNTTAARAFIQSTATNSVVQIRGNRNATDAAADVELNSTATRTAGFIAQVQNAGVNKLQVDFQGLLTLGAQAGPLQPASIVTNPTLGANWTVTATKTPGYWKDANGIVHLRGEATFATGSGVIFTLPVGFRPTVNRTFVTWEQINGAAATIFVDSAGNVTAASISGGAPTNGNQFVLDVVSFLAEQ